MKIKITGAPPYDGEYPADFEHLTNGQIRTIKRLSGYTPLEYERALKRGDNDFIVAIAVAVIERDGRHAFINEDAIWNAQAGGISLVVDDTEVTDGPPLSAPETPSTPSGAPSPDGGDNPQVRSLPRTGTAY